MADLTIKIGASSTEYKAALEEVSDLTSDLSDAFKSIGKVSAAAFASLSAAIGFSIKQFADAEKIALQTNSILKATGSIAGVSASEVNKLAESLASETSFSDEAVKAGENILLTFTNIGQRVFPQATQATLDLATKMGVDAKQAAEILGKALQDPENGLQMLKRAGVDFTDVQKSQIKTMITVGQTAEAQKLILQQLSATIGGLSQESARGVEGSFLKLKNTFEDIAENVGAKFAPSVQNGTDTLRKMLSAVKDSDSAISTLAETLKTALLGAGVLTAAAAVAAAIANLGVIAAAVGTIVAGALTLPFLGVVAAVGVALGAVNLFEKYKNASKPDERTDVPQGLKGDEQRTERANKEAIEQLQRDHLQKIADQKAEHDAAQRELEIQNLTGKLLDIQGYDQKYIELQKQFQENETALLIEGDAEKKSIREGIQQELEATMAEQLDTITNQQMAFNQAFEQSEQIRDNKVLALTKTQYTTLAKEHQKSILDEKGAQQQVVSDNIASEIDKNNRLLKETQRYGEVYAKISSVTHADAYMAAKNTGEQLIQLSQSNNTTLKTIGKAAAVTNIITKTAESAMSIFAGWSSIPYVGYALGIAGAAAAVAFGAEQVSTVLGANTGGVYSGGIAGRDSIPAMYTPGELVVPTQNFDEVINSVASSRGGGGSSDGTGALAGNSNVTIQLELVGDLGSIVTAKQIENRSLGVARA